MRRVLLALASATLIGAPAAHATPSYRLLQREHGSARIQLVVSTKGSRVTEYVRRGKRLQPTGGAIVRYRDSRLILLEPRPRIYAVVGIFEGLAQQQRERASVAAPHPAVKSSIPPPPAKRKGPRARLRRGGRVRRIAGLRARPMILRQGTVRTRIWYALDLPRPPGGLRRALKRYGSSGPRGSIDRALSSFLDDVILRREVKQAGRWRKALDTIRVRRGRLKRSTLAIPRGWHRRRLAATGARKASVPAGVVGALGPVINHPDIFAIYWGTAFRRTGFTSLMDLFLRELPTRSEYGPFWDPLIQYGVGKGSFRGSAVVGYDPYRTVGSWNFGAIDAMVMGAWTTTGAPAVWWRLGDRDPVITIFVSDDAVNSGGWDGYHLWTPSPSILLPFPISLAAHPAVPWTIVRSPSVSGQPSFGRSTPFLSHELVEAATDPFPFTAWADPLKVPIWSEGEISDICLSNQAPWGEFVTLAGNLLQTYWSQRDKACVPESRPTVSILSPKGGATVRADRFFYSGTASSPVNGDISHNILWSDDKAGKLKTGPGGGPPAPPLALGPHTLTAAVLDGNGLIARDSVNYTVYADPPLVRITSPLAGATYPNDRAVPLRGQVSDPQGRGIPDSKITWLIDDVVAGQGASLDKTIATPGPHTVKLRATNAWDQTTERSLSFSVYQPVGQSPTVSITQPLTNPAYGYDAWRNPMTLSANASDPEDGPLNGASVKWYDSYPGVTHSFLGQGSSIQATLPWRSDDRSANEYTTHTVTVEATDSVGNTTTAQVTIYVGIIIT